MGFLKLRFDGAVDWWTDNWLGQVPLVANSGALYTMPMGLRATAPDGTRAWEVAGPHYSAGEPAIGEDGTVYAPGNDSSLSKPAFHAVAPSGRLMWSFLPDLDVELHTWPAVSCDGTVYFGSDRLWALTDKGVLRWAVAIGATDLAFPAVGPDGMVYVGNGRRLFAIDASGKVVWDVTIDQPASTVYRFGHIAIAADGRLYVSVSDDTLQENKRGISAFSAHGVHNWTYETTAQTISEPLVDADGVVYVAIGNQLTAFDAAGAMVWSWTADGAAECSALAIAADGTTYARCDATLFAFGPR